MIDNDQTRQLLRHINGGIRNAIHDYPEFGLQTKHIDKVSKRIAGSFVGDMLEKIRVEFQEQFSKEILYQELEKENKELREKCETMAKSNRYLLNKLKESGK